MLRWLLPWMLLVLAGCSGFGERLQPVKPLLKPPASAAEAIAIARDITGRGRWAEGLRYLDSASLNFPADAAELAAVREEIAGKWQQEERRIEDRILVSEAENLRRKVGLLEKLSLGRPDDLVIISRRIYWRERLTAQVENLVQCAEHHVATTPQLAKRCFDVASWLSIDSAVDTRLAAVDEQLRKIASVAAQRRRANEERERKARARVLMDNARAAIDAHDYRGALDTLKKVEGLQPGNEEVAGLQEQAMSMISPQIEALIKLGDHLYLDEQLEAAVATWKAALTLQPQDEEIIGRIDRAQSVLGKLEALRQRQKSVPVVE